MFLLLVAALLVQVQEFMQRRKGIRTGIVAERFGGQVMDTMGIENFISVKRTEGPKLVASLEEHVKEYDIDVMNLQRAKRLEKKNLLKWNLKTALF